jgi:signal transduction histidine kinase
VKIHSQLAILVVAVLAPVALLAAFSIERLWDLQRKAYEQQYLERVSALRLALDTEIEATVRTLRTVSEAPDLDATSRLPLYTERLQRLLANNPMWSTIGLVAPDGAPMARADKGTLPAAARIDPPTLAAVAKSRAAEISNLVSAGNGEFHFTYLAVPVLREGAVKAVVYIGIEHSGWLEFLHRYPVSEKATLTLNDRESRIIARTLNSERWVGRESSPRNWKRTIGKNEGAYINTGLEGQKFYSAFSRSRTAGWLLGSGVPQDEVEAALRRPTIAMIAAVIFAAGLAIFFALWIGRRISGALTSLAGAARAMTASEAPVAAGPLAVSEAETVRRMLEESAAMLRARQSSLSEALQSEARSRGEAERASNAKDEFLAMLGHELRNPLSAMSTASDLLQIAADKPDTIRRSREVLHRQLRHLTGIVDDMLDVARLTSGKVMLNKRVLDLAEAAKHVTESFKDSGRCSHLHMETSFVPAPVYADETRIEQVIANLLDNACKYSPRGRKVWIEVGREEGQAVLRVRDSGTGIAPDLLPHVFDTFAQGARTLDRAQGGLGLGLGVVRRLVELHGGSVSAASDGPDRGAGSYRGRPGAGARREAHRARGGQRRQPRIGRRDPAPRGPQGYDGGGRPQRPLYHPRGAARHRADRSRPARRRRSAGRARGARRQEGQPRPPDSAHGLR